MEDSNLLQSIKSSLESGEITKSQLLEMLNEADEKVAEIKTSEAKPTVITSRFSIVQILYVIGGLVIYFGIGWLLSDSWNIFPFALKLAITLGLSLVCLVSAKILNDHDENFPSLASLSLVNYIVSFLLFPIGVYVLMDFYKLSFNNLQNVFIFMIANSAFYKLVWWYLKKDVQMFFLMISGVITLLVFEGYMLQNVSFPIDLISVNTMVVGLGLFTVGLWVSWNHKKVFLNDLLANISHIIFQGFGLLLTFSSLTTLRGFSNDYSTYQLFWEIMIFPIILSLLYLSNKLKSETTLIITGLYLLVYITLIVNRFLADTVLGGGASFIIIGILIITAAVGLFKFKSLKL
jgi:hypothetical protein